MGFWDSIILGIVEGITEFLPISSTGHLILASEALGIPHDDFVKSFEIAIQLGAILSVVWLYSAQMLKNRALFLKVCTAFAPTALIGFFAYPYVKGYLLGNSLVVVVSLFLGGIGLILFEKWYEKRPAGAKEGLEGITWKQSVLIGLFQSVAMVPGVSRAAATILGGLAVGIERKAIVEFSFLLAVPTMLAATALDMSKSAFAFEGSQFVLLAAGFFGSFVVAIAAIKFLLSFIETHSFKPFGWYRMAVAAVFGLAMLLW